MTTSKQHYISIPQDRSEADGIIEDGRAQSLREIRLLRIICGILSLLLAISILVAISVRASSAHSCNIISSNHTGIDQSYKTIRSAFQPSPYSSKNKTEADLAWSAVYIGHGIVAVDQEWATSRHLPPSLPLPHTEALPSNGSKHIYTIQSYHSIHCVRLLRKNYYALATGGELGPWTAEHISHCFDALRQDIMCHADDTLLYGWGKGHTGYNQPRVCRDWGALRNWATENTACYDLEPEDGRSYWGQCVSTTDYLIETQ